MGPDFKKKDRASRSLGIPTIKTRERKKALRGRDDGWTRKYGFLSLFALFFFLLFYILLLLLQFFLNRVDSIPEFLGDPGKK